MRRSWLALAFVALGGCGLVLDVDPPDPDPTLPIDAGKMDASAAIDAGGDQDDASIVPDAGSSDASGCEGECDDGVACTEDRCVAGQCEHLPKNTACEDGIECTVDTCDVELGCVTTHDDAACEDGVGCTLDVCGEAGCFHEPDDAACEPSSRQCFAALCDPELGCTEAPIAASTPCDDGNRCSTNDACGPGGACQGRPVACTGTDTCDPVDGVCRCAGLRCGVSCLLGATCCPGQMGGACGRCGIQRCNPLGAWECDGQHGTCDVGATCFTPTAGGCDGCGAGQQRVCNTDCNWGGCFGG